MGRAAVIALVLGVLLWVPAQAATTSVEMLRNLFQLPITEWKQQLKANSRLLTDEFFSNIDKRVRWGIENNHVDDAFRFAMVGDFAAEAVNRPANYRIDLADLFFKAENDLLTGQIVDNIIITSPGTPQAMNAQLLRARLKEKGKDLFGAYQDYAALTKLGFKLDESWYRCGLISEFIGEVARAKEEYTKAIAAGNRQEAQQHLDRILAQESGSWDQIPALPNAPNDRTKVQTDGVATTSPTTATSTTSSSSSVSSKAENVAQLLSKARLQAANGQLVDAAESYSAIFDPSDAEQGRDFAAVYYRMGALDKAQAIYEQALHTHPNDVDLLRGRANTLERLYDRTGQRNALSSAVADYKRASELAPNHPLLSWELKRAQSKAQAP